MNRWRIFILNSFGSDISYKCFVYSSVFIWAPFNLSMNRGSCLGPRVNCYNIAPITLGVNTTISQDVELCTASHIYSDPSIFTNPRMALVIAQIVIQQFSWVTSGVFVGPGVLIGEGSVILARSVVTKDTLPYHIYSGNPASIIRKRSFLTNV
jgi:putative colanic acid biosynthesis acetyltransferase WcaF